MRYPTAPFSIGLSVALAISLSLASIVAIPSGPAQSRERDRTLKLFFGHTGERGEFTFKRNGRYDRGELRRINHFLRDWRKGEDAKMDPQLLDLIWTIYQEAGSRDYIHVISAYRSPATNEMLRSRSRGVAKNSQHRLGKAMDWYVPDVPLAKLRAAAMKAQGGGVGYYPRSGSPFVHTDTGNVRAWPRMSRQQLLALFPNGNTLHLPADGKPLPGYDTAVARRQTGSAPVLAYAETESSEADETDRTGTDGNTSGWLRRVFPGDGQNDATAAAPAVPPPPPPVTSEPQQLLAASEDDSAPRMPRARPGSQADVQLASLEPTDATPLPRSRPETTAFNDADAGDYEDDAEDAIAALTARMDSVMPAPPMNPIELAFASLEEEPNLPSEADRAILSAFTAVDSQSVREADATLRTAIAERAAGGPAVPAQPAPIVTAGFVPTAAVAAVPSPVADQTPRADAGFVLSPDGQSIYTVDQNSLLELIDTPASSGSNQAKLAMPSPGETLYDTPQGAAEVTDLRGEAGPPVDRFSHTPARASDDQGFFSKLFASLIE